MCICIYIYIYARARARARARTHTHTHIYIITRELNKQHFVLLQKKMIGKDRKFSYTRDIIEEIILNV